MSSEIIYFNDLLTTLLTSDMEFSKLLMTRMVKDYEQYKIHLVQLEPLPYKEQFNPTFLFHLDILAQMLVSSRKPDDGKEFDGRNIHIKFYSRNNFYLCILTCLMNRILIFIYKINDRYRQEIFSTDMINESTDPESTDVVFHRIHDASDDVKVAVRDHWVSKESGFFLNGN